MKSLRRDHNVSRRRLPSTILILENNVTGQDVSAVAKCVLQGGTGDVQGVDNAGNVTKDGQQDVDEEVSTTAALEEDTKRREDDGDDDLDDVAEEGVSTRRCFDSQDPLELTGAGRRGGGERVDSRSGERHVGGVGLKVLEMLLLVGCKRSVAGGVDVNCKSSDSSGQAAFMYAQLVHPRNTGIKRFPA